MADKEIPLTGQLTKARECPCPVSWCLAAFEWSAPGPRTRSGTGFAAATGRASNWARSAAAAAYSAAGRRAVVFAERMTATDGQKTRHLQQKNFILKH